MKILKDNQFQNLCDFENCTEPSSASVRFFETSHCTNPLEGSLAFKFQNIEGGI
jgi:hypothetical protein